MTDKERIAELERRLADLERERVIVAPFYQMPDYARVTCAACASGGVCLCYRPERGPMCAVA